MFMVEQETYQTRLLQWCQQTRIHYNKRAVCCPTTCKDKFDKCRIQLCFFHPPTLCPVRYFIACIGLHSRLMPVLPWAPETNQYPNSVLLFCCTDMFSQIHNIEAFNIWSFPLPLKWTYFIIQKKCRSCNAHRSLLWNSPQICVDSFGAIPLHTNVFKKFHHVSTTSSEIIIAQLGM